MSKLLTSVRNLEEARRALEGGTDWLDLKEPKAGALGAVPIETVSQVVEWSNTHQVQVPVSATIGDCWENPEQIPQRVAAMAESGVDFVKVGIFADRFTAETAMAIKSSIGFSARLIVLCFAEAPPAESHIRAIAKLGATGLMMDTAEKKRGRLIDKMSIADIHQFVSTVKAQKCLCGLAGSLQIEDVDALAECGADYLGFRGAVCEQGIRDGDLSAKQVDRLKKRLQHVNSIYASDETKSSQKNT